MGRELFSISFSLSSAPTAFPTDSPLSFPFTFGLPSVDGTEMGLSEDPFKILQAGDDTKYHKVPIIMSAGADEGTTYGSAISILLLQGDLVRNVVRKILPTWAFDLFFNSDEELELEKVRELMEMVAGRPSACPCPFGLGSSSSSSLSSPLLFCGVLSVCEGFCLGNNPALTERLYEWYVENFDMSVVHRDNKTELMAVIDRVNGDNIMCEQRGWASEMQEKGFPVWTYLNGLEGIAGHAGDMVFIWRQGPPPADAPVGMVKPGDLTVDAMMDLVRDPSRLGMESTIGGGWPQYGTGGAVGNTAVIYALSEESVDSVQSIGCKDVASGVSQSPFLMETQCESYDGREVWVPPQSWGEVVRGAAFGRFPCPSVCELQEEVKGMAWRHLQ